MKRIFILLILSIGLCLNAAAQLKSEVSECFELTSIVFRLADADEYVVDDLYKYTRNVDKYFAPYKEHPVIAYCKKLRETQGISYDAVANAGAFIEIVDGQVKNKSNEQVKISAAEQRWTEESFAEFVKLANDFYQTSNFANFYAQHSDLHKLAEQRYDSILYKVDVKWFPSFFGGDSIKYSVILSLCNGRHNYGFKDEHGNIGSVVGTASDANGDPLFNPYIMYVFIHETIHGYANKIIEQNWSEIEGAATKIFATVADKMSGNAYGSAKTTMKEWLVRLSTLMYAREHPNDKFSNDLLMDAERQSGFVWMDSSVKLADDFYANRAKYNTIGDFVPELIAYINRTAENIDQIIADYNMNNPHVVSVSPANYTAISADTDKVVFKFSTPMKYQIEFKATNGICAQPLYWQDPTTLVFPINIKQIASGTQCGIILMASGFTSEKGIAMVSDYQYMFKISEQ